MIQRIISTINAIWTYVLLSVGFHLDSVGHFLKAQSLGWVLLRPTVFYYNHKLILVQYFLSFLACTAYGRLNINSCNFDLTCLLVDMIETDTKVTPAPTYLTYVWIVGNLLTRPDTVSRYLEILNRQGLIDKLVKQLDNWMKHPSAGMTFLYFHRRNSKSYEFVDDIN